MTDPKDGQPKPGLFDDLNETIANARMTGEIKATKGIGARILQRRQIPQPENTKGDDTTPPPTNKGRGA